MEVRGLRCTLCGWSGPEEDHRVCPACEGMRSSRVWPSDAPDGGTRESQSDYFGYNNGRKP